MFYPHLLNIQTVPVRGDPFMFSCLFVSLPLSLPPFSTGIRNWKHDNSAALVEVEE